MSSMTLSFSLRFRWLLALLLLSGASGAALAQFRLGPSVVVAPAAATVGGTIGISGDRLKVGGDYSVELVGDRDRITLATVPDGDGFFYRVVTVPQVATGIRTVELLVDGVLVATTEFKVLSRLGVSFTDTSPNAGATVPFTVTGLAAGSLTLLYEGAPAFGPVKVGGGSYSGKLRVPTDRPARLPATVTVIANNGDGKLVPRVGSRTLDVQPPDTRPYLKVTSAGSSTDSPSPRERFSVAGTLAVNEGVPALSEVNYFWVGADGSVQPMGASTGQVQADGSFGHEMRTPQIGTMSARTAAGSGQMRAVTRWTDRHGVIQQTSTVADHLAVAFDTDAAIDLNITLIGSDGLPIVGARIDLVEYDEELYNDNGTAVPLEGALHSGLPVQFDDSRTASDELLGCPANLERQYTDAEGKAEFEFDLDMAPGGTNVDGSGPTARATIEPTELCVGGGSINDPGFCLENDPAGVEFTAVVRAAHVGYGYVEPIGNNSSFREIPVLLNARVDRYTGHIDLETCLPGWVCSTQSYEISANKTLFLPRLEQTGPILSDPSFISSAGFRLHLDSQSGTNPVRYRTVMDLTPLEGSATFDPEDPEGWTIEFHYDPGAGRPLKQAKFKFDGRPELVTLTRTAGDFSCDGGGGTEVWQATLPSSLAEGFRFPRKVFGAQQVVKGTLTATDMDDNPGSRLVELRFNTLTGSIAALAGTPGLKVETARPHARRLSVQPPVPTADTTASAVAEYELGEKHNELGGAAAYELCIPSGSDCGATSGVGFDHEQFSRSPASQPEAEVVSGSGQIIPDHNDSGGNCSADNEECWTTLFEKTIPLFRWYWGVPELLSAEVFADLVIKAQHLLSVAFNPAAPDQSEALAGGRLILGIFIGVDIDVLFGILIDAGAGIYGGVTSELVTTTTVGGSDVDACLKFTMDFIGWLEIGCPIPNPFDPTCYIPDIEENFNIINEHEGVCASAGKGALSGAVPAWPLTPGKTHAAAPPAEPMPAGLREAVHRHPALAVDGFGNRLVLYLDRDGHLVSRHGVIKAFEEPVVVSEGYGIRDTAVTFFGNNAAVAVWSESALAEGRDPGLASAREAARFQRLRYAIWDGSAWTTPEDLTQSGFGDGHVALARCVPRPISLRSECLSRRASVVFQRNLERTIEGRKGIFIAHFDGTAWTVPTRVDQSGDLNITPAIAWQDGEPVVAWVRHDPGRTLDDVDNRRIAVRRMDGSAEELGTGLPSRVAQPTLAAASASQLTIGFTRAAPGDAFVGTRQAMHLGQRKCTSGCRFTSWQVRDIHNRAIYGERPVLNINAAGEAVLTFRGLAVGAVPGAPDPEDNLFPEDPPGIRATSGELMQLRSPLSAGKVPVVALSNDGAWHARPAAAVDPANGEVVAVSITVDAVGALVKRMGGVTTKAAAKLESIAPGVQIATIDDLPDLVVAGLTSSATVLDPGTTLPVQVLVRNLGSAWTVDGTRSALLRLWWDTPEARVEPAVEIAIDSLAAGATAVHALEVTVPASFGTDERQSLVAEILVDSPEGEIDGMNNQAALAIGGMPVPAGLLAVSVPGTRFVNLAWTAPEDPRIAGYRVYIDDPDGVPRPFGSSFNLGFADLTALYDRARTYRVSSYSARGIESELSDPIVAEPAKLVVVDTLFGSGFE